MSDIADDTELCSLIERLYVTFDRLVELRPRVRYFDKTFTFINADYPPAYYAVKEAAEYLTKLRDSKHRASARKNPKRGKKRSHE